MQTNSGSVQTPANVAPGHYILDSVTSKDGTTIGYRQFGHGPGVVILHGAMSSSQTHQQLAEALADAFTVYVVDRRGRDLSGPHGRDYSIQKEVEDLDALLTKTGAHNVFGVSSGALISLRSTLALPTIHKAVLFEPPLSINGSAPTAWLTRYDKEIAQGKVAAALVTGMKGAQMGPALFRAMPHRLLELFTNMAMTREDKKAKDGDVTWRMLASALHYDGQLLVEMAETLESFRGIGAEVLLLGGSKSPNYLKFALDGLEKVLPHVSRVTLTGMNHGGAGNSNMGGQPEQVAQQLRKFFA